MKTERQTLKIEVLVAEQATGSWKSIKEQATRVLGRVPMRGWDDENKMFLTYLQDALSLLQPDFERGIHPTDPEHNQFGNHVEIRKGDWLVRTSFGPLILTSSEYEEFVR